jgi:hypothetical protein
MLASSDPLDHKWRFSGAGAAAIIELLRAGTCGRPNQRVALLGTPTLAEAMAQRRVSADVTLFEQRPEACDALRLMVEVVCGDVAGALHGCVGKFAAAVADPPWYPAVTERFIAAAAGRPTPRWHRGSRQRCQSRAGNR